SWLLGTPLIFPQTVIQGFGTYAEHAGSLLLASAAVIQRCEDELFFHLRQRAAYRDGPVVARAATVRQGDVCGQVFWFYTGFRHDAGTLDNVLEFAQVARPTVAAQCIDGLVGERLALLLFAIVVL